MTDYIQREIETDEIADEIARQRERVTALPDEPNDIPIDQAVVEMHKISKRIEAIG